MDIEDDLSSMWEEILRYREEGKRSHPEHHSLRKDFTEKALHSFNEYLCTVVDPILPEDYYFKKARVESWGSTPKLCTWLARSPVFKKEVTQTKKKKAEIVTSIECEELDLELVQSLLYLYPLETKLSYVAPRL